jgi:hypothetical protein
VGSFSEYPIMFDMIHNAAKYYTMSLRAFDEFYRFGTDLVTPLDFLMSTIEKFSDETADSDVQPGDAPVQ